RDERFGITTVTALGYRGPVELIFIVTKRRELKRLLKLLKNHAPSLFFTVEDVRRVNLGWLDIGKSHQSEDLVQTVEPDPLPSGKLMEAEASQAQRIGDDADGR